MISTKKKFLYFSKIPGSIKNIFFRIPEHVFFRKRKKHDLNVLKREEKTTFYRIFLFLSKPVLTSGRSGWGQKRIVHNSLAWHRRCSAQPQYGGRRNSCLRVSTPVDGGRDGRGGRRAPVCRVGEEGGKRRRGPRTVGTTAERRSRTRRPAVTSRLPLSAGRCADVMRVRPTQRTVRDATRTAAAGTTADRPHRSRRPTAIYRSYPV